MAQPVECVLLAVMESSRVVAAGMLLMCVLGFSSGDTTGREAVACLQKL